jgi:diguanylate cyclase (GGDEF)-like protein
MRWGGNVFFDRSRKRQLESLESRELDSLRVFHEVARALTSNLALEPLLRTLMSKMETFFGPDHWSLLLLNEERTELYYALTGKMDLDLVRDLRLPLGVGIAGHVALYGRALVIPDVRDDLEWSRYADEHPELNLQSIACLPIRHGERTLGVLQIHNSRLGVLPEASMSFLRVLCDYTAIALENARQVRLIHELSITDDCTGLFNARHLYTTLEEEITAHSDPRVVSIRPSHFSLLFFDLDRFKSINDKHGHLAGSGLLAEIGDVLKRLLGPAHIAFRYGGDEFVVVLRDLDEPAALELTQKLRERLNETVFLTGEGLHLRMTASFGLATFPQHGSTLPDLIRSADTMMYAAKAAGRDCIVVADALRPAAAHAKISRHG